MSEMDINKRLDDFEQKQELMNDNLETMLEALIGNKLRKDGGMIEELKKTNERLNKVEEDMNELKKFKDRIVWTVLGLLSLGSGLSWVLSKVIDLNNHK